LILITESDFFGYVFTDFTWPTASFNILKDDKIQHNDCI
jgi:hypothetical protein